MQRSPRRPRTEWQQIITDQEQSGLSLKAYGEQHQINYHTLIYWRQEFRKNPKQQTGNKFIKIAAPTTTIPVTGCIKLSYDYNLGLELPTNYAVDDLVKILKGLSC